MLSSQRSVNVCVCVCECVWECVCVCPRWSCFWRGWGTGRLPSQRLSLRWPASRGSSRSVQEREDNAQTHTHTDKNKVTLVWIIVSGFNQEKKKLTRGEEPQLWKSRERTVKRPSPKDDIFLFSGFKIKKVWGELINLRLDTLTLVFNMHMINFY